MITGQLVYPAWLDRLLLMMIGVISQFVSATRSVHYNVLRQILRYLYGTVPHSFLCFRPLFWSHMPFLSRLGWQCHHSMFHLSLMFVSCSTLISWRNRKKQSGCFSFEHGVRVQSYDLCYRRDWACSAFACWSWCSNFVGSHSSLLR